MSSDSSSTSDESPTKAIDEVVHQRVRLGLLTIANEARRIEFRFLQESMALTAGNLSQHIRVLEEAGFIRVTKGAHGRRPRTWVSITRAGRAALHVEVASLKALIHRVENASQPLAKDNP
jgi:DNA-binding MarR family transcriptional regulator